MYSIKNIGKFHGKIKSELCKNVYYTKMCLDLVKIEVWVTSQFELLHIGSAVHCFDIKVR